MAKILDATCENNEVTCEELAIEAQILSEGVKASSGKILIDEDKVTYLTSNASDIKDLIINLGTTLDKLIEVLNICNSGLTSAGAATAKIAELVTEIAELKTQKDNLK